ncbi:MAG: acyl-[acyl-carrier-protein] thioesterase [Lachnospiraceae bacterium]|nr:acyl-[acyl-carrier-protein] thioesterase [Lachnospiraceae bacterium]
MYHFDSRVRYSETGEDGCLTLTGVIDLLQDCSTFQSEDCGVGVKYLESRRKVWMLSSWRICIDRYPELGEQIRVGTWPYGNKGIYGYRNFVIEDLTGQRLVEADSTWFLLDLDSGLPCRVRQEDVGPYGEPGEKIPMEPAPKKISLPSIYEEGEPVMVRSHHIDTNHHVNNAQYVEIAREVVPGGTGRIRELRVEYKKAAVLGDVIYPKISREGGQITVLLQDGQGGSYAILWMRAV